MSEDTARRRRIAIIAVSSFLLVAMVVAVTVGVTINDKNSTEEPNDGNKKSQISASVKAIKSICKTTDFKKTCEEQVRKEAGDTTDINVLVQAAFKAAMKFASQAAKNSSTLRELEKEPRAKQALDVCKQLLTYSIRELEKSFHQIDRFDEQQFEKMLADLKIWLSATITHQQTCLDGFKNTTSSAGEKMKKALNISMQLSRNGLAIATGMAGALKQLQIQGVTRRRLLEDQDDELPVLGHSDLHNWNYQDLDLGRRRPLLHQDEFENYHAPVLGHANLHNFNSENLELTLNGGRPLLQQDKFENYDAPVLGHTNLHDWNLGRGRRLLQQDEIENYDTQVLGHTNLHDCNSEDLNLGRRRRLLQQDEIEDYDTPVLGHSDLHDWNLGRGRRLLQQDEIEDYGTPVLGHTDLHDWNLGRGRRLLQEDEIENYGTSVLGHTNLHNRNSEDLDLGKRHLLQQDEIEDYGTPVLGHTDLHDWNLGKGRRLLQQDKIEDYSTPVLGHTNLHDWNLGKGRRLLQQDEIEDYSTPVLGHTDLHNWNSENLDRGKQHLLQQDEIEDYGTQILGHTDLHNWNSEDINPGKRHLLQQDEIEDYGTPVLGHNDLHNWNSEDLDLGKRRLLQQDEIEDYGTPILGHTDLHNWNSEDLDLGKRRLLQQDEIEDYGTPVLGHTDLHNWNSEDLDLGKRRLLQQDEIEDYGTPVLGHTDLHNWNSEDLDLGKRHLLQQNEIEEYGTPFLGHTDLQNWNSEDLNLDGQRRRLLQQDKFENYDAPVLGHNNFELQPTIRRLMEANASKIQADIVVAKDGSGQFTTIKAAMGRIPLNATKPFVVYIKQGVYEENLEFPYWMTNLALIGDGKEKTRITGHLNNADGVNTFKTATVAVNGDQFFAKNIGFENSAGPQKFQAVALLVLSDKSVFYNCSMDGYQDTLYVHSKRQFYRDCTISGTIDFVFGDAAAVFQNCTFLVRKPLKNQQNAVTAQGRFDVREPTAIVIQNSTFMPAPDFAPVKGQFKTYLGRPWGNFSRTIIMESRIDDMIAPEGWAIWNGTWGLDSCYYAEFNNKGPGSSIASRVGWRGIKRIGQAMALGYTPAKFIEGDSWINATGVPYIPGFTNSSSVNLRLRPRVASKSSESTRAPV